MSVEQQQYTTNETTTRIPRWHCSTCNAERVVVVRGVRRCAGCERIIVIRPAVADDEINAALDAKDAALAARRVRARRP